MRTRWRCSSVGAGSPRPLSSPRRCGRPVTSDAAAPPLMRQRAARLAQVHNTHSPYNRPESGKQMASKANRAGGADRWAAPAVPKSSAIDLALLTSYAQLLNDGARSLVKAAKPHDAHPLSLRPTGPGSGKRLSLVRLYAIHDMDRFPRGQDCGSSGRLGKGAKESAGKRWGTSGKKIGNAHLQWALSEAAALVLRNNPAGPHAGARLENKPGQGNALPILAHKLARAVYDMRKRPTAFAMEQCLHGEGSRVEEPAASLDMEGRRLERACATSWRTASLPAKVPRGLLAPRPRLCLDIHSGSCTSGASRTQGRGLPLSRAGHSRARR
jgi:hypothetical protein